jgi:hypothetical protein
MDLQRPVNYPKYTETSFGHWTIALVAPTFHVGAPLAGALLGLVWQG